MSDLESGYPESCYKLNKFINKQVKQRSGEI
jgi:hypothetical protein